MPYKRVIVSRFGPPLVLQVIEEPRLPEPGPGEVRVRVEAVSAAYTDTMIRRGVYPEVTAKPPFSPGYDMVGTVDEAGAGAGRFRVGERVCDLTVTGAYAEYLCLPEERLVAVPGGLDPGAAVSLVLTYVTAYQMLQRVARVGRGQTILVHGAGGAVGSALVELAGLAGAAVIGTASLKKHAALRKDGLRLIDYRNADVVAETRRHAPDGVDAAFDGLGRASFARSLQTLRPGGILVAYGFSEAVPRGKRTLVGEFLRFKLMSLLPGSRRKAFYSITKMRKKHPDRFAGDLQTLFQLLADGRITPRIWKRLPLTQARRAHELIELSAPVGKIVLEPGLRPA